ncbi:MAG: SDR family NAD(P)-dependent oxidoreductase, partial [Pseudomonadales bacterium]|nr:SDR family NAD(P)-dependent oxidoreductase [Pseudomonadales bacterium]
MKELKDKVAFVTGGASGIGFGIASALTDVGVKVVIADIEQKQLDKAVEKLKTKGADVLGVQVDVTDRVAMEQAAEKVEKHFGNIHILCNNAGVASGGSMDKVSYKDWDWVLGVNIGGVVNGVMTFVNRIKSHGEGGHIINTASLTGHMAAPGMGVYNT